MSGLFVRLLGEDGFARLPAAVQRLHQGGTFTGEAEVGGPEGFVARVVGWLVGFPAPAAAVPVRVTIEQDADGEVWIRDFGGRRFRSRMAIGAAGLEERFGPFAFRVAVPADDTGLRVVVRGWRVFGIPLPLALAPLGDAVESEDAAGRFRFDVAVGLPLGMGQVVRYRGWLV
ncbi:DUF4166 domain-containing protein [Roseomonas stagni]|uniref:DUF4166 domain-containing protein n=1 Tax=Falsiroseomonas algicola TaxID=2716930 RepID=A0A6M1LWH3_9PROT|nr:DUF4166 domain-containing protein [Falsiroseomonas algicola]NGM24253.1 DUF4166 domain-containing protein [Falsiroseomonas algicola]